MGLLEAYKALADESRLRLLNSLGEGSFNVQELTTVLGVSQPTISHHLKILQAAGLVHSRKEGTWVYYTLSSSVNGALGPKIVRDFLTYREVQNQKQLGEIFGEDLQRVAEILDRRRDKARDYFDSVAGEWSDLRVQAQGERSYFQELHDRIPESAVLLELGCGSGAFLEHILPREGQTIGVDYSQAMLDEAAKNLGEVGDQVDLRLGALEHLPLGDNTIDVAVAYMVFHHVAEPRLALQDVNRVLKSGGVLHVFDLTQHTNEEMRARYADLWLGFDPDTFGGWARDAGFSPSHSETFGDEQEVFLLSVTKGGLISG